MTPSIRTFLLINLLLSVTLITSLAIIGNLFFAHKDIQTQLDAQLIRTALRMQALVSDYPNKRVFKSIQQNLGSQSNPAVALQNDNSPAARAAKDHINALEFQIWDRNGKLLLRSLSAPAVPLSSGKSGLSTLWLDGKSWRINTVYDQKNGITLMVGERANYRQQLENQLTQDSIIIMLMTYPLLGFLIWIIVGRGLDTLKRVATEVRHREAGNLSPVDIEAVPSEIEPLVSELNNLFRRLQDAFERNRRFTADAAHELKTPLAALSAQVQVALRSDTSESRKEALFKVLAGVNRSTHVVQQLLTLSRMAPETGVNEPVEVKLGRVTSEVAALLAPEAIANNIDLELLAGESDALVWGNPTAISILVRNLVDNAIRYSDDGGYVKINIFDDEKTVTLSVEDNGPGIPEDMREQVFERFYRIPGAQATGSGLGLGIVMQIAKLHDAEIKLLTPPSGEGLEVHIVFPRYYPDKVSAKKS